jgi:ubiquinone/menaquinone biosynthesis C-methylase UbiE
LTVEELLPILDEIHSIDSVRAIKRHSFEAVDSGAVSSILDLACGAGNDLTSLRELYPSALVSGVDLSMYLLAAARHRGERSISAADAMTLPFRDATFSAVRADRLLQHLPSVDDAMREVMRVSVKGARIVLVDVDWSTAKMHGGDAATWDKVLAVWLGLIPHPRIGSTLTRVLEAAGCVEVTGERFTPAVASFRLTRAAYALDRMFDDAIEAGVIKPADRDRWFANAASAERQGRFQSESLIYVASGVHP